ncbi:hypothetical protein ASPZODRAFT_72715 [Penicilliopsis zonata CBS 506.65]|uniref:BYS1 domain protein n=1 Tax=Penicilliopsis zonata CBS 506.65 TaxID=1073090 RepID=A0A1L9SA55_9EURO|nr:hypothetical protein ASPZODRAFT_72715 [Penicilliopsis zonata CBS 506.65]OJJ43997.1 hypothetical protein ASPZODRAFT_72715 [Penicilliopsis zonata CBS 506.65]
MYASTIAVSLAALTPLAAAVGSAVVVNKCADTVYLWSVGGSVGPEQTLASGDEWSEEFYYDSTSGGVTIKITRGSDGLYDGSAQTDFAYTLDGDTIWYDLSDVFGDPFSGHAVLQAPSDTSCPSNCWSDGVSPAGSQTLDCQADSNVTLTLCAGSC